ncbi:MAG TPA: carboxypeptidase-like regulatory domain-containing protein [Chitinophaga sp.]|uniref:Carboxypeptidase-like regulatory domain-containing protein n=1 Tax=Chitinophaga tropicalis TaxID=2683588 RepID=A0A7K1UB62_9BACT|nr:carboxypeptidase-like regulatory domain-containing protein [Chitinophaga tropicalis]MVT11622.1 carboxypeptidase-like regulatory domain-containing protein [Chitinophaga tropicalis]HJT75361.1 carboxypeptidase-like regulatory domain-containing protein [Chitinophaga sp.]
MHKKSSYILLLFLFFPFLLKAQLSQFKDSIIQISGITMTADSLRAIPAVSVLVRGQNRGTISNSQGVFSIVAFKGDTLTFSAVGFKRKDYKIPTNLPGNNYSMIQLLVIDTTYLPVTIIRPYPSREEFDKAFVSADVPDDEYELARKNTEEARMRALSRYTPPDAREATNSYLNRQAQSLYYAGQQPPQGIMNPLAWAKFIQAWKRGDFKNKSNNTYGYGY